MKSRIVTVVIIPTIKPVGQQHALNIESIIIYTYVNDYKIVFGFIWKYTYL